MEIKEPRGLLVSWHYPPDGAVGALRWQKSVRDLGQYGWRFDVMTGPERVYGAQDPVGMEDVPQATNVFRVAPDRTIEDQLLRLYRRGAVWRRSTVNGTGEPTGLNRNGGRSEHPVFVDPERIRFDPTRVHDWKRSVLSFLHWPEGHRGWWAPASRKGYQVANGQAYDVIVSSGPPHVTHLIARRIGRAHGIPHVADFRDPWTGRPLPHSQATPTSVWLDRRFERRVIRDSALVLTTTEMLAERYRRAYGLPEHRIACLPNGGDLERVPKGIAKRDRFTIVYAGSLYLWRSPRIIFEAVGRLISNGRVGPQDVRIRLVGECEYSDGMSVRELARDNGLEDVVEFVGNVTRQEAAEELAAAHVVLVLAQQQDLMVPHKLYEALVTPGARVLAIAPPASATASVLAGSHGVAVAPNDVDGVGKAIAQWIEDCRSGRSPAPADADRYSRQVRSQALAKLLDGVVERAGQGSLG